MSEKNLKVNGEMVNAFAAASEETHKAFDKPQESTKATEIAETTTGNRVRFKPVTEAISDDMVLRTAERAVKVAEDALNLQSGNVNPGFSKTQAEWVIESLIKAGYNIEKAEENETESLVTRDELEDESPDEEKLPYVTVDLQVKIYHETDEGLNTPDAYEPPYGYLAVREVSVVNTSFHYNITDIDPATADDLDPDGWLVDSIRDVLFDRDAVEDEEDEDYA